MRPGWGRLCSSRESLPLGAVMRPVKASSSPQNPPFRGGFSHGVGGSNENIKRNLFLEFRDIVKWQISPRGFGIGRKQLNLGTIGVCSCAPKLPKNSETAEMNPISTDWDYVKSTRPGGGPVNGKLTLRFGRYQPGRANSENSEVEPSSEFSESLSLQLWIWTFRKFRNSSNFGIL